MRRHQPLNIARRRRAGDGNEDGGKKDLEEMIEQDKGAEAVCHFCGKNVQTLNQK